MSKMITIDVLRQVADNSIGIYDAFKRAQTLTEESKGILTMAEDLLRQAGLAYLSEIPESKSAPASNSSSFAARRPGRFAKHESKSTPASNSSSVREGFVSAYVAIQQSYADLKDALYRPAQAHIDAKAWDDVRAAMEALLKIDAEYRDVANMLRQSFLAQAKALFEQKKWEEGRAILKQRPTDKEMRLAYLISFLEEKPPVNNRVNGVDRVDGLRALRIEEPRLSQLLSYQRFMSDEATDEYFQVIDNIRRSFDREIIDSRDIVRSYSSSMLLLNTIVSQRNIAVQNYIDSQDKRLLEDLRAELSSII